MKIESFYKFFLMTPVTHFPVVGEDGAAVGLLSKEKISREMADLESIGIEYEVIPDHLLTYEITDSIVLFFQSHRTIPVLNIFGQRIDTWEKPRLLAECSDLLTKKNPPKQEQKVDSNGIDTPDSSSNKLLIYKFMELILKSFPDALFSTDKDGNTTFYNEKFETYILSKHVFRDSITIAEKYFRELNRDLISEHFKSIDVDENSSNSLPILQAFVKNINMIVKIVTLKGDDKVIGFLYHLIESESDQIEKNNLIQSDFPILEKAFQSGVPLLEILKDVESSYILKSFKLNHENISHTASSLGIPRSTLQNRIKYLDLSTKMARDPETPVPRQRRESRTKSTTKVKTKQEMKNDDFIEDPDSSQAKKLLQLEAVSDNSKEDAKINKNLKKKSVSKRKSSSQMNSKKK
jgi:hypothetical protein